MSENEKHLKIRNQIFSHEIDLDMYVEWDALSRIDFISCNLKKCQFGKSTFENCEFVNIDLTRAELGYWKFVDYDLSSTDFFKCVFFETRFHDSNLKLSTSENLKFWKFSKFSKSNSMDDYLGMLVLAIVWLKTALFEPKNLKHFHVNNCLLNDSIYFLAFQATKAHSFPTNLFFLNQQVTNLYKKNRVPTIFSIVSIQKTKKFKHYKS